MTYNLSHNLQYLSKLVQINMKHSLKSSELARQSLLRGKSLHAIAQPGVGQGWVTLISSSVPIQALLLIT